MIRRDCEPTLEEILSDPIVMAVMHADAVDSEELRTMLSEVAGQRQSAAPGSHSHPHRRWAREPAVQPE